MTLNSCKLSTDSFLGFHSRRSNSNTRRDVIDPKMILVFFRFRHEPFVKLNIILCALHFTKQRHAMQLMARVQEREIIILFSLLLLHFLLWFAQAIYVPTVDAWTCVFFFFLHSFFFVFSRLLSEMVMFNCVWRLSEENLHIIQCVHAHRSRFTWPFFSSFSFCAKHKSEYKSVNRNEMNWQTITIRKSCISAQEYAFEINNWKLMIFAFCLCRLNVHTSFKRIAVNRMGTVNTVLAETKNQIAIEKLGQK